MATLNTCISGSHPFRDHLSKAFSPTILNYRVLQLQEAESNFVNVTISRDKGKVQMLMPKKKKKVQSNHSNGSI